MKTLITYSRNYWVTHSECLVTSFARNDYRGTHTIREISIEYISSQSDVSPMMTVVTGIYVNDDCVADATEDPFELHQIAAVFCNLLQLSWCNASPPKLRFVMKNGCGKQFRVRAIVSTVRAPLPPPYETTAMKGY